MQNKASTTLMAPALAWLTALMVVPCALILALAFLRRGIYGGIEYTFTMENLWGKPLAGV
jgi:spermidine/putrescine transport system permease protein